MATDLNEPAAAQSDARTAPRMRAVYRDAAGTVHRDWPVERIGEALADLEGTLWLDIEDPQGQPGGPVEVLFRDVFGFHPLAIEDALKESNIPKIDDWDRYLYLVFHAIEFDSESHTLHLHELDLFLARNFLVSYHTEPMPIVEKVWKLVERDTVNRLRRRPDHLTYLLLDQGVTDHLIAIEHLDAAIDDAQDEVFDRATPQTLQKIFRIKRSVMRVHRIIGPQREVANKLARDSYPMVGERDRVYFRDLYDGLVRLHDISESVRDLVGGALETYLSVTSNRTNDIMKTLTIVSVLFLPLNFLVGFFGMNFFGDNIVLGPDHPGHIGLFVAGVVLMLGSASSFGVWAHRRGWF